MSYFEFLEVCSDHYIDPDIVVEDYPNVWTLTKDELHEFLLGAY